jgi:hypothetical protein
MLARVDFGIKDDCVDDKEKKVERGEGFIYPSSLTVPRTREIIKL